MPSWERQDAPMPQQPSVSAYVRERLPRLALRWVGIIAFVASVHGAFRIRDWGASWETVGIIAASFAIAAAAAVLVTAAALTAGGILHSRGFVLPEWLTRRRGE